MVAIFQTQKTQKNCCGVNVRTIKFSVSFSMAFELAQKRYQSTKTAVNKFGLLDFAVPLIAEFTDFMDIRQLKVEALAEKLAEGQYYDNMGEKMPIKLDHNGHSVMVQYATEHDDEGEYMWGKFVCQGDYYCTVQMRQTLGFPNSRLCLIGDKDWADLAETIIQTLEHKHFGPCVLCATPQVNSSKICSDCALKENQCACRHCGLKIGKFFQEEPVHPVCRIAET